MNEFHLQSTAIPLGVSLIEASAGTGKTWVIAHLLPRLIIEGRLETLDQAVLVTYTNDAARELAERVRRQLSLVSRLALSGGPAPEKEPGVAVLLELLRALPSEQFAAARRRLLNAQESLDRLLVSTLHSFCRRVLSDEGFFCGMPEGFELMADPSDLRLQAMRDVWRAELGKDDRLALLAAMQGWSLDADLRAWKDAEAVGGRLFPRPVSLQQGLARLQDALSSLKTNSKKDLKRLAELLSSKDIKLKTAACPPQLGHWQTELEQMDPAGPGLADFELVTGLAKVPDWVNKQSKAGKAAAAEIEALPLVTQALEFKGLCSQMNWAWTGHAITQAGLRLKRALSQANAATYEDLIARVHQALQGDHKDELAGRLRKRWRVAMVDESQDTDQRQLDIFTVIFHAPEALDQSLIFIGDPKQAIYGFRGADLDSYYQARDLAPSAQQHSLTKTQRSAPALVSALNAVFGRLSAPLADPKLAVPQGDSARTEAELPPPDDGLGRLVAALVDEAGRPYWDRAEDRRQNAAAAVASAIVRVLGRKMGKETVGPANCAVLTRSNREAGLVFDALRERGVPAVQLDNTDVLSTDMAEDLAALLQALLEPSRAGLRRRALATLLFGLDAAALAALTDKEDEDWQRDFVQWGAIWQKQGLAALLQALEAERGLSAQLATSQRGERHLTDLRHLAELLQNEEPAHGHDAFRLWGWFSAARAEASEAQSPEERSRRLDRDGAAVQIYTMHRVKGLEFDLVFCPFLWSSYEGSPSADFEIGRDPDRERALIDPAGLDGPQAAALRQRQQVESLEDELRLAYVALTRAKRRVWLLAGWIGYGKRPGRPNALDWLLQDGHGEDPAVWIEKMETQKRLSSKADEKEGRTTPHLCEHLGTWSALEQLRPGFISSEAAEISAKKWTQPKAGSGVLSARLLPKVNLAAWQLTSFSRFVQGPSAEKERFDPALSVEGVEKGDESPVGLASFAKGRQAGECLHGLLEHWDFKSEPGALIEEALRSARLTKAKAGQRDPAESLVKALPEWATALVPALDCSLAQAAVEPALSEWAFMLPLGKRGLDGADLARVFEAHAASDQDHAYVTRLRSLPAEAVNGLLHGFIDRLLQYEGRWAVIDWKSNHLGDLPRHYEPQALYHCAAEHHYILQVHLYLLALRRHLRLRDPEAQAVGAGLAFLRGLKAGTERGLLMFTPSSAMLDELEALFQP